MTTTEALALIDALERGADQLVQTAKVAKRGGKSLSGDNPYGRKFRQGVVEITAAEERLRPVFAPAGVEPAAADRFATALAVVKNPRAAAKDRSAAFNEIHLVGRTAIRPKIEGMTASPVPQSEQVLLASVVAGTRTYIESIVAQANGAYHHQWFDACAVMMRRLIETLIIEVYEAAGRAADIKTPKNEFMMLDGLLTKALNDPALNLSRNVKEVLPKVKEIGDMSAHSRRYNATRRDIEPLLTKFGAAVQTLLSLAKLK